MYFSCTNISNLTLSVATFVKFEKNTLYNVFIITNLFLNNRLWPHLKLLSPRMANGDKVGHPWARRNKSF
jgi:hypothetical protein